MRKKIKIARAIVSASFLVVLFGCNQKQQQTAAVTNTKILTSGGWVLNTLVVDNVDKTNLYAGMTLAFDATNYTSTKGAPVWPGNGSWSFSSSSGTKIGRSDGIDVTIDSISDAKLVLSLDWTMTTYGRQSSISGHHIYTFTK